MPYYPQYSPWRRIDPQEETPPNPSQWRRIDVTPEGVQQQPEIAQAGAWRKVDEAEPQKGAIGPIAKAAETFTRGAFPLTPEVVRTSLSKQAIRTVPRIGQLASQAIGFGGGAIESKAKKAQAVSELFGLGEYTEKPAGLVKGVGRGIRETGLAAANKIGEALEDPSLNLPPEKQGRLWENKKLIFDPEWLAYNIGETAQSLLPVIGATVVGGPAAGAIVGGGMEGLDLYNTLMNDGIDHNTAAVASSAFGIVTGILNKIGAGSILKDLPSGIMKNVINRAVSGGTEAITEYLEEPFQAAFDSLARGKSLKETRQAVLESLKNIDVIPGSFIMGGGMAGGGKTTEKSPPPLPENQPKVTLPESLSDDLERMFTEGNIHLADLEKARDAIIDVDPKSPHIVKINKILETAKATTEPIDLIERVLPTGKPLKLQEELQGLKTKDLLSQQVPEYIQHVRQQDTAQQEPPIKSAEESAGVFRKIGELPAEKPPIEDEGGQLYKAELAAQNQKLADIAGNILLGNPVDIDTLNPDELRQLGYLVSQQQIKTSQDVQKARSLKKGVLGKGVAITGYPIPPESKYIIKPAVNLPPQGPEKPEAAGEQDFIQKAKERLGGGIDMQTNVPRETLTEPEPSKAQIKAGNYKKGHIKIQGLDISIENEVGSTRKGVGKYGIQWKTTLQNPYGYIRRTEGADGDKVDTFIGPNESSQKVFIVNQQDPESKKFDEHKVMLGFDTEDDAKKAYQANYYPEWKGLRSIQEMTMNEFKNWLKHGDQKKEAGPPVRAKFVTWDMELEPNNPRALYEITNGPDQGSTVGVQELEKRGIEVPNTPARPPTDAEIKAMAQRKAQEKKRRETINKAKTFRQWVLLTGGVNINDPTFKGDFKDIRFAMDSIGRKKLAKGFPPGFWRTSGKSLDERVTDAIEDGWLPPGSTDEDFMEAVRNNLDKKYSEEAMDSEKIDSEEMERYYRNKLDDLENGAYDERAIESEERRIRKDNVEKARIEAERNSLSPEELAEYENFLNEPWEVKEQLSLFGKQEEPKKKSRKFSKKITSLSDITVMAPATRESTGEKIRIKQNAQEAVDYINNQIDTSYNIKACLDLD